MASGKAAFDAAAAEAAKAAMIAAVAAAGPAFAEPGAADPASESKPEIWTNWDDFVAKANNLNAALTAADVTSLETLQAGMGAIGGACQDCHKAYRL